MTLSLWLPRIAWLLAGLFTVSLAYAHSGATGIVKERMEHMKVIAKSAKTVGTMLKGETPFDPASLREAALRMRDHGGEAMTKLFPQNSLDHPTEALPMIWEEWSRFEALALELEVKAEALAGANEAGAREAFAGVAETCKDCHEMFRMEKE